MPIVISRWNVSGHSENIEKGSFFKKTIQFKDQHSHIQNIIKKTRLLIILTLKQPFLTPWGSKLNAIGITPEERWALHQMWPSLRIQVSYLGRSLLSFFLPLTWYKENPTQPNPNRSISTCSIWSRDFHLQFLRNQHERSQVSIPISWPRYVLVSTLPFFFSLSSSHFPLVNPRYFHHFSD